MSSRYSENDQNMTWHKKGSLTAPVGEVVVYEKMKEIRQRAMVPNWQRPELTSLRVYRMQGNGYEDSVVRKTNIIAGPAARRTEL